MITYNELITINNITQDATDNTLVSVRSQPRTNARILDQKSIYTSANILDVLSLG